MQITTSANQTTGEKAVAKKRGLKSVRLSWTDLCLIRVYLRSSSQSIKFMTAGRGSPHSVLVFQKPGIGAERIKAWIDTQ